MLISTVLFFSLSLLVSFEIGETLHIHWTYKNYDACENSRLMMLLNLESFVVVCAVVGMNGREPLSSRDF